MFKICRDMMVIVVLFIAMSKIGNTQELMSDDGGVRLKNGCYTMVIVVDGDHGKRQITIQDCRGGRSI
tara:strand:- start:136 stop:339 length:204 start_codon:yes stop_codon:yes gene_type:complete